MNPDRFPAISRLLHWLMAAMILAMLFIGVAMAATLSPHYHLLVAIHRPLGIAILVLAVLRLVNRRINPPPDLPEDLPVIQQIAARSSHILLYALMLAMPLIGWSMLSAAGYPIVLYGPLQLPPILPANLFVYAVLRSVHTTLAYLLFATILAHLGAALFHAMIRRDGIWASMVSLRGRATAGHIPAE
jgi:cytochrome b561